MSKTRIPLDIVAKEKLSKTARQLWQITKAFFKSERRGRARGLLILLLILSIAYVAVTVLTSLHDADLHEMGIPGTAAQQVVRLAQLTKACGLDGVVCSAHEAATLRAACGPHFRLVTPGIRPADAAPDDQARIVTPAAAIRLGADYLVIGRPITQAPDPLAALAAIDAAIAGVTGTGE